MAWQQQSTGGPAAGVETIVWRASTAAGGPLVIACFDEAAFYQSPQRKRDLKVMAETGLCVVAVDAPSFGNDAALDRIDDVIAWAAAELGADIDRVSFIGDSRGATTALNWAWRHPSQLGAAALRIPAVALEQVHDNDLPPGVAAEIEAAYGGLAGYETALPDRDPSHSNQVPLIQAIADRCRAWYSTDDPWILPAQVTTWAAAVGVDLRILGDVDHDPWTPGAIRPHLQAAWIWDQLAV